VRTESRHGCAPPRIDKERSVRRKRLRRCIERLKALQTRHLNRDRLPMTFGTAKREASRAADRLRVHADGVEAWA